MDSQQQQYCLKWNSFGSNLATSFANLWNSESLADVTLYCEGRQFKAHKVILAACSKHFQELFDTAPPSHAGACYVILEATTADNMQALLEFMYKGEVHVSQDALSSFLKSGENLQVKGLSMEMSPDAWVKQQTQQPTGDRHQARIKTSPVSGSGNCEAQDAAQQSHTATFAPIMPQYGVPIHGSSGGMGRYAPPAHMPMHTPSHRRPAAPKPSPSPSPHVRNYRNNRRQSSSSSHCGSVADEPDTRSSPGASARYEEAPAECTSTLANPVKNNGYERSASANEEMMERLSNDQGAEDLRIKSENDYQSGYNNSPPPAMPIPTTNFHEKPLETSPVPPKPSPDIWPAKIITSKSGGIATADGKKLKCPYCERLYGYETNLRAHIRQRHQGIRVPCPHCTRTFTRNNTVRRHIAREHRHAVTQLHQQGPLPNHTQKNWRLLDRQEPQSSFVDDDDVELRRHPPAIYSLPGRRTEPVLNGMQLTWEQMNLVSTTAQTEGGNYVPCDSSSMQWIDTHLGNELPVISYEEVHTEEDLDNKNFNPFRVQMQYIKVENE